MNEKQLSIAQEAFLNKKFDTYSKDIGKLLDSTESMDPTQLMNSLSIIDKFQNKTGMHGLQPLVHELVSQLNKASGGLKPKVLKELRQSSMFEHVLFEDWDTLSPFPETGFETFWEDLSHLNPYDLPPKWVRHLIQVVNGGLEEYPRFTLTSPLVLDPVEACSRLAVILDVPSDIPDGFTVNFLPESIFGGNVIFSVVNREIGIATQGYPRIFRIPIHAQTESFLISISHEDQEWEYEVTVPVSLAIRKSCEVSEEIATPMLFCEETVSLPFYSSGPQGTMEWNWSGDLPDGLGFSEESDPQGVPTGHVVIAGQVNLGAHSTEGSLRLQNGNESVTRDVPIKVAVHLDPQEMERLSEVIEIQHGQQISIPLPTPMGGDGRPENYRYELHRDAHLPEGLQIIDRGNDWYIEGEVSPQAEIAFSQVDLYVHSGTEERSTSLRLQFNLSVPCRVLTQNMLLFPSNYAPAWVLVVPFLNLHAAALEIIWDLNIHNTSADNDDRVQCLMNKLSTNAYPIVALQEVWRSKWEDGSVNDVIDRAKALGYREYQGPRHAGFEISSGLILLVKDHLSVLQHFDDEVFDDTAGDDSHAQKGFTLSKIRLGNHSEEYVYLVNTHLQASKEEPPQDNEDEKRHEQVQDILQFLNSHTESTHPIILMGDFNVIACTQGGEYDSFRNQLSGYEDIFEEGNQNFLTINKNTNLYKNKWGGNGKVTPHRLDYILVKQGTRYGIAVEERQMEDDSCLTGKCEHWINQGANSQLNCYLSDHYGLSANLKLVDVACFV